MDRPAGLASAGAGYRWLDVTAKYASWLATEAAKATWADLLAGV